MARARTGPVSPRKVASSSPRVASQATSEIKPTRRTPTTAQTVRRGRPTVAATSAIGGSRWRVRTDGDGGSIVWPDLAAGPRAQGLPRSRTNRVGHHPDRAVGEQDVHARRVAAVQVLDVPVRVIRDPAIGRLAGV